MATHGVHVRYKVSYSARMLRLYINFAIPDIRLGMVNQKSATFTTQANSEKIDEVTKEVSTP